MESKRPENLFDPVEIGEMVAREVERPQHHLYSTGLPQVDRLFKMYAPGRLIGLQASTSNGKSTLLTHLAVEAMAQCGENEVVLFCTWEDSVEMFGMRVSARHTQLPMELSYTGQLTDADRRKIKVAAGHIQASRLWILGHSENMEITDRNMTMTTVLEAIRYIDGLGKNVKFIFLDYLQQIDGSDLSAKTLVEKNYGIVARAKNLAISSGACVWLATQVDRDVIKNRKDKLPQLGDAMYTSNFEHSCDAVISLAMPCKYEVTGQQSKMKPLTSSGEPVIVSPSLLVMEIQKQKVGATPASFALNIDYQTGKINQYSLDKEE